MELNLPSFAIRTRVSCGRREVWDPQRRRWVRLSPEEWVRQHFVNWLVTVRGYAPELIANEVELRVCGRSLRADTVVYSREGRPVMIVEYKAPEVRLTEAVFEQLAAYNALLDVDFLAVSNGIRHVFLRREGKTFAVCQSI